MYHERFCLEDGYYIETARQYRFSKPVYRALKKACEGLPGVGIYGGFYPYMYVSHMHVRKELERLLDRYYEAIDDGNYSAILAVRAFGDYFWVYQSDCGEWCSSVFFNRTTENEEILRNLGLRYEAAE